MTYEILTDLHGKAKDLSGQSFGRLTAIAPVDRNKHSGIKWLCICECSSDLVVISNNLTRGNTTSCGCLNKELHTTHGLSDTPEYRSWLSMIHRVTKPNDGRYNYYGGRGIRVCSRWIKSFENFYADMGKRPSQKHSIDRINNNGDYEPRNCRWATQKEQCRNMRTNRLIEHNGETRCVAEWAEIKSISYQALLNRLNRGWTGNELFKPVTGF